MNMSHERVLKALISFGLNPSEAEIYVHLANKGSNEESNIAKALKIHEKCLHQSLRSLKRKKLINAVLEHPTYFSAVPFDKALDMLVKSRLKEARNVEQKKDEILRQWNTIIHRASTNL
jgi:sugar-specific transcriptional regulator TrmB